MTARRLKSVDSLWLFLALLLHSVLLLLPKSQAPKLSEERKSISVVVDVQSKEDPYLEQPERYPPPLNPQPANSQEVAESEESQPATLAPREVEQLKPQPSAVEKPSTPMTTSHLLLDVSELKFALPQSEKKGELGVPERSRLPANWLPSLKLEANMFTGKTGSGKTEIVDQWKSVDGVYNVIVKTPGGKTLCGHAQPRQRISSMEEPVVMWRLCD